MDTNEKPVDIKRLIASKNKFLANIIPGFLYHKLGKLLHVDSINQLLTENKDKLGVDFADAMIKHFNVKVVLEGTENINPDGRYIIAGNHPLGGMDGIALISTVGNISNKGIIFPVNDVLWMLENLRPVFARINKFGSNRDNIQTLKETFAGEKTVLYFPAGLCSRKQKNGTICDLEWKSTVISQARRNKRDIIPVFVDALNTPRFYNIAYNRKKWGIKFNIEQLFLVDECYKYNNKQLHLIFGEPIPYSYWDKSHTDLEWAEILKQKVYALKPLNFNRD
ncbi:glycerol acyltransferase [Bacteroidia bacterium]|nr:glycerol acyltransferase [Bacteroidia bacterium]